MKVQAQPKPSNAKPSVCRRGQGKAKAPKRTGARTNRRLQVVNPHAAGMDIGASEIWVAVPPDSVEPGQEDVRSFSTFTADLDRLVEWLKQCHIATVAMEATGVYWIPIYQKVESAGMEAVLVNAKQTKHVTGRKSDLLDCQWIQELHSYGLLQPSFRPAQEFLVWRTLQRQRRELVQQSAEHIQHMQKALRQMNVLLDRVVSDVHGATGLRIIEAILAGEREVEKLLALRDARCTRATDQEMKLALEGDYRREHLVVLRQSLAAYRFVQGQVQELDLEIKQVMSEIANRAEVESPSACQSQARAGQEPEMGAKPGREYELKVEAGQGPAAEIAATAKKKKKKKGRGYRNEPQVEFEGELGRIAGVDLTQIPGISVIVAMMILSEIGPDLKRFRSARAFCAWLGLSPNVKISGGAVLSSRTPHVVNLVAVALRMAAMTLRHNEGCLGRFYRRKQAHLGAPKAITATARKLACIVYRMLKERVEYREPDPNAYEAKVKARHLAQLQKQAKTLGFMLVPGLKAA